MKTDMREMPLVAANERLAEFLRWVAQAYGDEISSKCRDQLSRIASPEEHLFEVLHESLQLEARPAKRSMDALCESLSNT